jgi:hypothetical protein
VKSRTTTKQSRRSPYQPAGVPQFRRTVRWIEPLRNGCGVIAIHDVPRDPPRQYEVQLLDASDDGRQSRWVVACVLDDGRRVRPVQIEIGMGDWHIQSVLRDALRAALTRIDGL